jgi:hypothetical protein
VVLSSDKDLNPKLKDLQAINTLADELDPMAMGMSPSSHGHLSIESAGWQDILEAYRRECRVGSVFLS